MITSPFISSPLLTLNKEHPINPPPELIEDWIEIAKPLPQRPPNPNELAALAARWGADQELEACCEWIANGHSKQGVVLSNRIRAARRPKPPSLKELALETLLSMQIQPCVINGINTNADLMAKYGILRRALESLPD